MTTRKKARFKVPINIFLNGEHFPIVDLSTGGAGVIYEGDPPEMGAELVAKFGTNSHVPHVTPYTVINVEFLSDTSRRVIEEMPHTFFFIDVYTVTPSICYNTAYFRSHIKHQF